MIRRIHGTFKAYALRRQHEWKNSTNRSQIKVHCRALDMLLAVHGDGCAHHLYFENSLCGV